MPFQLRIAQYGVETLVVINVVNSELTIAANNKRKNDQEMTKTVTNSNVRYKYTFEQETKQDVFALPINWQPKLLQQHAWAHLCSRRATVENQ